MSKKRILVKEINSLEKEIEILESKRSRSMAVMLEALLNKTEPKIEDVQFFRTFTANIEAKREHLQLLTEQLEALL